MKTQYIGTYTQAQIKSTELKELVKTLQSKEHMRSMQYVNERNINNGAQVELWLSDSVSEFTTNCPKA